MHFIYSSEQVIPSELRQMVLHLRSEIETTKFGESGITSLGQRALYEYSARMTLRDKLMFNVCGERMCV